MNLCSTTYTVHRDGSAQRVTQTCGSGTKTATLPAGIVSNLFSDLQAAQPLGALAACPTVDSSLTVAWNGQQSPNIGNCNVSNAAEQALSQQIADVISALAPVP